MTNCIKYLIVFLVLLWSVLSPSKAEQKEYSAIYTVRNGRLIPLKNTTDQSDRYYGRSTNSTLYFNKIIKDKYGKEINE